MPRTETKLKSVRKPLRDVSNNINNGSRKFSSKSVTAKKKSNDKQMEKASDDRSLDRLMLVQSDLSTLLQQIDELVVQAFKVEAKGQEGRKEIESFTHVLSEMLSTLKPWVPRFQNVLSSSPVKSENQLGKSLAVSTVNEDEDFEFESPEDSKADSLISPSPLVSWRADCTIERSRQLFLLTPLPMSKTVSSKHQDPTKSVFKSFTSDHIVEIPPFLTISEDANDDLLEGLAVKPTPSKPSDSIMARKGNTLEPVFVASPMFSNREDKSVLVMTTPCLKLSPPKSCVLLEPISECSRRPNGRARKSTPYPVGIQKYGDSSSSDSSDSEGYENLTFKYPELLGIRQASKSGIVKKELEASPDWLFSPPKSCVLLQTPDEKSLKIAVNDHNLPSTSHVTNPQTNLSLLKEKEDPVQITSHLTKKSCYTEQVGSSIALVESTPMLKEPESMFRSGKRPGENTLKKELWTRFEAASTFGLNHNNAPTFQRTARKGFLDMLEEVSCDEERSVQDDLS